MAKDYETLSLSHPRDHILLVTLNRPDVLNAMNTQMGLDLRDLWMGFYVDQADLRVIILTGAGQRAFCAGGDLKQRNNMTDQEWQIQHAIFEQATLALLDCPIPVIAAVNGAAYGGGCEMALSADFIYAARSARFALTETRLGIMPGALGTQNLPRACGTRRAKEIILTATPFSAEDGAEWGIVNRVCDDAALIDETLETAERIAGNGPISVRQAKKSISMAQEIDIKSGYAFELEAYNRMVPTEDRLEGVRAFNEKRAPRFSGR